MSRSPHVRATALFAALAFVTSGRSQDPDPLPLPLPPPPVKPATKSDSKIENRTDASDSPVTVLEKGPIHEGFAQPGAPTRGKGITAPKAPPPPVDELPPDAKPDGANVRWLPGYWQWDAERDDFVWVCGCYRNAPPDRTWEPGRWREVKQQWTYFPGYWRPSNVKALPAHLPEPPASTEDAPGGPNDNPQAMWVPGVWEYKSGKYRWQAGYWPPGQHHMLWQQGQYVATEAGFAFVPAHWDYPLEERGLLYSPVYFSPAQREKRGWSYRPEFAIAFGSESKWGQGGAFDSLHIGPNYNAYYYGPYSLGGPLSDEVPQWDAFFALAAPLIGFAGHGEYRPWNAVARGYTNPLWQHYVRLNRADSGLAKGMPPPDAPRPAAPAPIVATRSSGGYDASSGVIKSPKVTNTFAFIQPAAQVVGRQSARVISTDGGATQNLVTKNTMAYQYLTPRGNVRSGVRYWSVSPPFNLNGR
jgi:hypothetical protein